MSEKRQTSKIFVGGLSWETTDARLRTYFENYGAVSEAFVSFDRVTGRPRGFGFVVFEDPAVADKVVTIQHTIDRREVEAKKAVPKEDNPAGRTASTSLNQRTKKIFVGGLAPSVDEQAFRKYFESYGQVEDAVVMYDHDNKRPRGFGFVTFATEEGVDEVFTGGALQTLHDKPIEIKRAVPRDQIASARGRTPFNGQQGRLESAASGFAAAAMGPAFQDDGTFASSLLHSHSLGAPTSQQTAMSRLATAASLGGQMPLFSSEISQNVLTNQIYQALSGQLSGQLHGGLGSQLSLPNHTNGLTNNTLANLARAGSSHLPAMGSSHLPVTLGQGSTLQQLGSSQLPPLNGMGLSHMGSEQLNTAKSGLLQQNYGMGNGLTNGMSGSLGHADLLGQDYSQGLQSQALQNHYANNEPSAFANAGANGFNGNHNHNYATGSAFANGTSDLELAFSNMGMEQKPSIESSNLPPPSGFEERVNMLSAGSAGLGQLPSPKLNTSYGLQSYMESKNDHHLQRHQSAGHELPVGTQAW